MKKIFTLSVLVLAINLFLTACGNSKEKNNDNLTIVASFYTMYDFANKIAGDKVNVINLMPSGTEVHDWEPSTKDMYSMENADIVVYNGAGMESWVDKVKDSLSSDSTVFLETTKDIQISENHDPHVWLDPMLAKIQMKAILDALCNVDPENSLYYNDNYEKYSVQLDELNTAYEEAASKFSKHEIIVAHEAYGYLCSAYGITQIGIDGLSSHNEPSPVRMSEIIEIGKEKNIEYIFYDEMESKKTAEIVAEEVGANIEILTSIETLTTENEQNGDDYFSLMYANLEKLKAALS